MKRLGYLVLITIVLIGIWVLYSNFSEQTETTVALSGKYENTFNGDGIVLRKEYPITANTTGMLQNIVSNGQKVSRYQTVAALYKGNIDASTSARLKALNNRINEITMSHSAVDLNSYDINGIDKKISSYTFDITGLVADGNFAKANQIKKDINVLLEKRSVITGTGSGLTNSLDSLVKEKNSIEAGISGQKTDLVAPVSGIYYDSVDGFESTLNPDTIINYNIKDIEKIVSRKFPHEKPNAAPYPVCKVVDNSNWGLCMVVDAAKIKGSAVGDVIKLRFTGSEGLPVDAVISAITPTEGNKAILTINCSKYVKNIYIERIVNVDVILKEYAGLKIPASAIRKDGEQSIVYVSKAGAISPKKVNVLYKDKDVAIIKENNNGDSPLLLYDMVVIKSTTLDT